MGAADRARLSAALFCGGFFGGDPAGFGDLACAAQGQCSVGDVLGDAAASGDVGTGTDGDGGDRGGVGADEGAVADRRQVLVDAVVVAGDRAGANVDAVANDGVA